MAEIEVTCQSANLTPERLVLRPCAAASLLSRMHPADESKLRLLVDLLADEADLTVLAGDTVPCDSLDALAAGAGALVHTVIRKDLIDAMPMQRIRDICDYHSSVEEAAATATRAGVGILILTHYVPGIEPGQEESWRALAASAFDRQIELGDDLHRVEVHPGVCH